jgi:hypothetical protein
MLTALLMAGPETGEPIGGQDMLFVHVDMATRRLAPKREPLWSLLTELLARQAPRVSPLPYTRRLAFGR